MTERRIPGLDYSYHGQEPRIDGSSSQRLNCGHGYLKKDLDVVDTDCFLRKVGRGLIMSQNIWVPAPSATCAVTFGKLFSTSEP